MEWHSWYYDDDDDVMVCGEKLNKSSILNYIYGAFEASIHLPRNTLKPQ